MLQATIAKMPEQEAIYYMRRCVDSGLWVPGKNDDEEPSMKENSEDSKATPDTPSNVSTDDLD
jgi:cell division cycle protein 37